MTSYRKECPDGRKGKADAQYNMTKPGEPLGITIKQDHKKRYGGKIKTKGVDEPAADHKEHTAHNHKPQRIVCSNDSFGYLPDSGSRVLRVKVAVQITIERHGRTSCRDHADQHQHKLHDKYPD